MVLPGTWRSLPRFEHDVALTMPDVARITVFPHAGLSSSHRIPEPSLDNVLTVDQLSRAHRSARSATARRSGKARAVLVVGTADVPAGLSHLCQIDAVGRRLHPARSRVAPLECRFPHQPSLALYAFHVPHDAGDAVVPDPSCAGRCRQGWRAPHAERRGIAGHCSSPRREPAGALLYMPYCKTQGAAMLVRVTSKRQVTFLARVLDALGVRPGGRIELEERPDGFVLRPRRIDHDRLGTLRGRLRGGQGAFDVGALRDQPHDPALRD